MLPKISMDQMVCSMAEFARLKGFGAATLAVGFLLVLMALGCGSDASGGNAQRELNAAETKAVLQELPYRYAFRVPPVPRGAREAIGGRVYGPRNTWFDFGIALGDGADPVPVPRAGVSEAVGDGGFVFTSNLVVKVGAATWENAKQIHSTKQLHTASHMATEMEERLCIAMTGEPCKV
jgi:hypothetical protein